MGLAGPGPGPGPNPSNSSLWYDAHNSNSTTTATPAFQAWALLLFVLSLGTAFGNMLVVLSITREKSLQTVTNYFIISLAVADIMVGVCVMPFEIYMEMWSGLWTLQVSFCDAYLALDVMSATASILNLAAISIDRFVAVTQPIKYAKQRNQPRVFGMIAISWLISIGVALPLALGVNEDPNRNSHDCQINNPDFLIYSSMCSFYIPCVVILCLYGRIFIEIRRRSRKKESVIGVRSRNGPHKAARGGKKQLKVSIESENTSTLEPPRHSARAQAPVPRISCSEAERNSGDTNDTSDEQPGAPLDSDAFRSSLDANGKKPSLMAAPLPRPAHDFACCIRHEYSVSELSFSSSFQRGSSMRMNVSRTASFELYENAFTDMDYVDEIDSPPQRTSTTLNHCSVLENCAALPTRSPDVTMHTIKEETNGALVDATVTANHHAIVTFEKENKPAAKLLNTNNNNNNCCQSKLAQPEAVANDERISSPKSSPSTRNEHTKLFKLTRRKSEVRRDRSISRERKVTKVMIIVLACFLACWMPFFCLNLVNAFCLKYGSTSDACRIERQLFIALTWLGYINSSLNPLIYCWQNREFRKAFHRLLTCKGQSTARRRH